jgi:hypothetical protein
MCPACLASVAVLLSGGAFSAFLAFASRRKEAEEEEPELPSPRELQ